MAVRVRMFASLRAAAGEEETTAAAGDLDGILQELRERYPPVFAERLAVSSVLVDGTVAAQGAGVHVRDGSEVALLPPVSGGARCRCGRPGGCSP